MCVHVGAKLRNSALHSKNNCNLESILKFVKNDVKKSRFFAAINCFSC